MKRYSEKFFSLTFGWFVAWRGRKEGWKEQLI